MTTHGNGSDGSSAANDRACGHAGRGERLALAELRRGESADACVDRVRDPDALRDPCRDPDRPVRTRRDEAVDLASPREPLDGILVLGREHGTLVGEREADRLRVPVDRDHVHVAARPRGLEETELGGARA